MLAQLKTNITRQTIFADNTYSKPYFVTYLNTAFFIIPLIPILIRKARNQPEELERWRAQCHDGLRHRFSPVRPLLGESPYAKYAYARESQYDEGLAGSRQLLLGGDEAAESEGIERVKSTSTASANNGQQLSIQETARLSLEFCLLWFAANYFVSACLEYTTVASSTILTSTSSVFTLLFGALFRVEKFSVRKLIAVLASLAGIALISSIDLSGRDNDADHRGDFPEKTTWELAIGDGLAFMSAIMYGVYAVFMKSRIGDESRVDMPMFFGLVGLLNVVLLWPGFFVLHFTGIEPFALPPAGRVTVIILANSLSSLVSDIAWAYAVLLTSPIVVTVGLSMTIPLSLVGQIVLNGQKASALYWVGAVAVVLSFVFVSEEEKEEEEEADADGRVPVDEERFFGAA
jgi:solute carrier family 35 protein F5